MLKVNNVSKGIRKKEVLTNITLEINDGDFVLIKGHAS